MKYKKKIRLSTFYQERVRLSLSHLIRYDCIILTAHGTNYWFYEDKINYWGLRDEV